MILLILIIQLILSKFPLVVAECNSAFRFWALQLNDC